MAGEHFAAYLTVSRYHTDTFDPGDLVVGAGGDTGIDALAVLVNGVIADDPEVVAELADTNGFVDASSVFIQAERSAAFEASKIGQFGFRVVDLFSEKPKLPRNTAIKDAAKVMAAVYERSSKFTHGNPVCRLFYVTTGKWLGDPNLEARRQAVLDDLRQLGIFRDVEFSPVGADLIPKLYNQTKNAISRDFTFTERTVVPEIPGVAEAYVGLLPAKEFLCSSSGMARWIQGTSRRGSISCSPPGCWRSQMARLNRTRGRWSATARISSPRCGMRLEAKPYSRRRHAWWMRRPQETSTATTYGHSHSPKRSKPSAASEPQLSSAAHSPEGPFIP